MNYEMQILRLYLVGQNTLLTQHWPYTIDSEKNAYPIYRCISAYCSYQICVNLQDIMETNINFRLFLFSQIQMN